MSDATTEGAEPSLTTQIKEYSVSTTSELPPEQPGTGALYAAVEAAYAAHINTPTVGEPTRTDDDEFMDGIEALLSVFASRGEKVTERYTDSSVEYRVKAGTDMTRAVNGDYLPISYTSDKADVARNLANQQGAGLTKITRIEIIEQHA